MRFFALEEVHARTVFNQQELSGSSVENKRALVLYPIP